MKKSLKKLFALAICAMLVLGMMTSAFADETTPTYTITINNDAAGHTYEAYQVFTGDLTVTGTGATAVKDLSDIRWGSGVNSMGILDAVNTKLSKSYTTAEQVAEAVAADNELTAAEFAKIVAGNLNAVTGSANATPYKISGLAAGYYLVKDKDNSLSGSDDSYTNYILELVSNVTVTPKSDIPTLEKKVEDKKDNTGDTAWYDSADHDIGDHVPFELIATLPDNITDYTSYNVAFKDTLSKGLTYDDGSLTVMIGSTVNNSWEASGGTALASTAYTVTTTTNEDGTTSLTIAIDDVVAKGAAAEGKIIVSYTATLNEDAVIGSVGNPNTAYLEYSNNPNGTGTGKTPEDKVIVFTYKVVVNKVTENPDYNPEVEGSERYIPLSGATFKLEKYYSGTPATWTEIAVVNSDDGTTFTFTGLDDGRYRLTETASPQGYNTLTAPIYFTVTANHAQESSNPTLTKVSVEQTNASGDQLQSGQIATFEFTPVTGAISTDIVNKAGVVLPSTGGIGTTLFYVVGGLMMAGAAVLLITKKRMNGCEG